MKRTQYFAFFLLFAVFSSAAAHAQSTNIFIEGTARNREHRTFFMENFSMEAGALGFNVVRNRAEAGYTFRFEVDEPEQGQFIIQTSLISNENDAELVSISRVFSDLDETYEFNQFLFFQTVILIPRVSEAEVVVQTVVETVVETVAAEENDDWRHKLLYLRASLDFPITFYALQSNGLIGGIGIHNPSYNPHMVAPLDNKFVAAPGVTLGLEVQVHNWVSIEPFFKLDLGDPVEEVFFNLAAGASLKFPLKFFPNTLLTPYATFIYHLNSSDAFDEFPAFAVGGGLQLGIKGGNNGSLFIDLSYTISFQDAVMHNPYTALYPEPAVIHYRRSVIGIGFGYKYGFIDRRR